MHRQPLPSLPPVENLRGKYRHYKGKDYELIDIALHSETNEPHVIYRALYDTSATWIRPYAMFFETVTIDGTSRPRFEKL